MSNENSKTTLSLLFEWFEKVGITYDKEYLDIDYHVRGTGDGLGIVALKDIPKGIVVCKIPKSSILSVKTSSIANILDENCLYGGIGLAIALMYEIGIGKKSHWYDYIQSIPKKEPLPMFWKDEHFNYLVGTELEKSARKDRELLESDFKSSVLPLIEAYPDIMTKEICTLENFLNASSLVSSRAFQVDDYHDDAMVPLADIFNHKTNAENVHLETDGELCVNCGKIEKLCNCSYTSIEKDNDEENKDNDNKEKLTPEEEQKIAEMIDIRMFRPCKKGEEVFNTYGEHPNASLLNKYGFTELNNPFDVVSIDIKRIMRTICKDDRKKPKMIERAMYWFEHRMKFLPPEFRDPNNTENDDEIEDINDFFFRFESTTEIDPDLRGLLLVQFVDDGIFQTWKRDKKNKALNRWLKALPNEEKKRKLNQPSLKERICKCVCQFAEERLKDYPTTLEEDYNELKPIDEDKYKFKEKVPDDVLYHRWALLLRIGEKQLLNKYIIRYKDGKDNEEGKNTKDTEINEQSNKKRKL
ncbi:RuBisCO-cytochrome methylase [Neocallimastix lanati (nom. inval.)]|jgi:hypothetical protein|uniref:Ribosomal lysine N-methyltransferase 4 n=1 Tax=Neocallimastix californiae TaxID=1754190 RepID=A0A1Y2E9T2_9FUNG|nr:RuBisCO-cytochrome methylase [Neocallimastix sp. JGI-2020a]ORY68006.1 RuBisCO-cytochrome methylase [Neocallimastix californiae]|eukprot:ORY68006.1 RuBisCO-cytochrome methylase [Neocallimastix californiae]